MMPSEQGLDPWLAGQASQLAAQELSAARVTAVDRGRYLVRNEQGEVPAELTGKLLHLAESSVDLPCVGDWVGVRYRDAGSQASIHSVLPRRSFLRRKAAGRDVERVAADDDDGHRGDAGADPDPALAGLFAHHFPQRCHRPG